MMGVNPLPPVAILAGGRATRLGDLAQMTPKALIEVAGRPFIRHQLDQLAAAGITRVVLCVGHLGDQISETIGDRAGDGISVAYSHDGNMLLGTGGALRKALPLLGPEFFVLYGDTFLDVDYASAYAVFRSRDCCGLMTVFRNLSAGDRSNVRFAGGEIVRYDKRQPTPSMEHIDYGLSILKACALEGKPTETPFDLAEVFEDLVEKGQMAAFEVTRNFYEMGSMVGLEKTREHLERVGTHMDRTYTRTFLNDAQKVIDGLDADAVEDIVGMLVALRERSGRLFIIGVGGGAGHASHAASDFRCMTGIEAYAPTDNVSELTARINDDGWVSSLAGCLRASNLCGTDLLLVFSVGGGDAERNISANIVEAVKLARELGATICGVVGRDGGFTAKVADACVVVPTVNPQTITAHTEAFQAVLWHLIVSHPRLSTKPNKWERTVDGMHV